MWSLTNHLSFWISVVLELRQDSDWVAINLLKKKAIFLKCRILVYWCLETHIHTPFSLSQHSNVIQDSIDLIVNSSTIPSLIPHSPLTHYSCLNSQRICFASCLGYLLCWVYISAFGEIVHHCAKIPMFWS